MRIAHITSTFFPEISGIATHIKYLSQGLQNMQCEVEIFTTNHPFGKRKYENLTIISFPALSLPFFSLPRFSPPLYLHLFFSSAQIFHAHGYGAIHPLFVGMIAKLLRKRFVFTIHGYQRLSGLRNIAEKIYSLTVGKLIFSMADAIIIVSENVRREMNLKKNVYYIPNGIDSKIFRRRKVMRPKGYLIEYVGRFDNVQKRVNDLIEAFAVIIKKLPNTRLLLIGDDGEDRKVLERKVNELRIAQRVIFCKSNYVEMPLHYSKADLVVLPSVYEGLSFVLLEALACGTPVLTTPVGDSKKVVESLFGKDATYFLIDIGNTDSLVEKILYLLKNKRKFRRKVLTKRRRLIQMYNWRRIVAKTLLVYKNLIGTK